MRAILAKLIIKLLAKLPLKTAHFIGGVIGHIAYFLPNRMKLPMRTNIAICFPDLAEKEKHRLYKLSFIELFRSLAEIGAMFMWSEKNILPLIKQVSGEKLVQDALKKGNGVLLALPHLGTWEILGIYFASKYPFTALYKPVKLKELNKLVKKCRERNGARLVATNKAGVRKIMEALDSNELVAILPDQDPGKKGSVFAPFCGLPASTMTLLPRLAAKTGATVLFCYAERLPGGNGFHIHILPAPVETMPKDIATAAARVNQGVENCLRKLPQQYQWGYKRFKTRPDGEDRIY